MILPNTINLNLPFGVTLPEVNSLHLEFNGHMSSYMTIEDYYESCLDDKKDWVSEEERTKAIETNQVWACSWYNKTPVGSYKILASSLEVVLQALQEIANEVYPK